MRILSTSDQGNGQVRVVVVQQDATAPVSLTC